MENGKEIRLLRRAVSVSVNGTFVLQMTYPYTEGYVGPTLVASGADDFLALREFVVFPLE